MSLQWYTNTNNTTQLNGDESDNSDNSDTFNEEHTINISFRSFSIERINTLNTSVGKKAQEERILKRLMQVEMMEAEALGIAAADYMNMNKKTVWKK